MTNLAPHPDTDEALALRGRPGYVPLDGEPLFAVLHLPPEGRPQAQTGVIICPPFGWDELGAHRSLRALAGALAQGGFPVLRFDLPGTGDSGGSPRDPHRIETWTAAVVAAAGALRAACGCERVVAVGVGLGGMIAYRALTLGAAPIDELVLWAVPSRGGLLVREMRTFARMADSELVDTGLAREEPPPSDADPLAEGDLNVAGFVLTAETLAGLEALDLTELTLPEASRRRVLLLGRDTLAPDRRLRALLEQSGVELTVSDGPGYDRTMVDPHLAQIPWETIARVRDWLDAGAEPAGEHADRALAAALVDSIELAVGEAVIRETPLNFDYEGDQLAAILTEPLSANEADLCVVLLNPGAVRHIGPQRMWVEAARRWAALGVSTLRLDVVAVGDSDGDGSGYANRGAFQRPEFAAQVRAAFDELERRGLPNRFLVGGVCSGAYWGLHAGLEDERVCGLLLLNLLAFYWTAELGAVRDSRRARALLHEHEIATVLRIIATDRWRITRMLLTKLHGLRRRRRREADERSHLVDEVVAVLDSMRDRGVQMTLALSLNEPLFEDFVADGLIGRLAEWPNVHLERMPTMEHVFRSPASQRMAHEVLDGALARTLGSLMAPPVDG
ncbi:MAG TPA: alpha/beta fold hydrolase [Solirubrobacteraceae bacterium]|nr:alpha/beta fold hydrolase [Solirubrobacteraceae bacterium]